MTRGKELNLIKKNLIGIQMSCGDSSSTSTVLSILTSEVGEDICGIGNNLEDEVFDTLAEELAVEKPICIEFRYEEFTNDGDIICDEEKSEVIEVLKAIQDFSDR